MDNSDLVLRSPIPVRITWDAIMESFTAVETRWDLWFGIGDVPGEALSDLAAVLADTYSDLEENAARLAPPLKSQYDALCKVIAHASQGR